jgi:formate dehydrogenase major subunit|tara:strand:- start:253 stop:498 length:246 start_codon:yes stop_codon:yes gene_type:complete
LEIHSKDAVDWGLIDGATAEMASRRGESELKVETTSRSPRGNVFKSFSFADTNANIITGSGYDPDTQTAELKSRPVRICPS